MYAFEYEVMVRNPGDREFKPFKTLALTESKDSGKARIEALQGAEVWCKNLSRTLRGTNTQLRTFVRDLNIIETEVKVHHACHLNLVTASSSQVHLVNNQVGGGYVGSVWVNLNWWDTSAPVGSRS